MGPQGENAITYSPWAFKSGEQLFENYGQPNYQYFMYHGFILQSNTHDCVNVKVGVSEHDTAEVRKVSDREQPQRYCHPTFRTHQ